VTKEKSGQLFNMSCSAIGHRVNIFKEKMDKDKKVKTNLKNLFHNVSFRDIDMCCIKAGG